jgi:hypothetical protein
MNALGIRTSMEKGLKFMKHFKRSIFVSAIMAVLVSLAGAACADPQPKSNPDLQRPSSKPSKWKSFKTRVKIAFKGQMHMSNYMRGNGSPEYDIPDGPVRRP